MWDSLGALVYWPDVAFPDLSQNDGAARKRKPPLRLTLWMVWFVAVALLASAKCWVFYEDTTRQSGYQSRLFAERLSVAKRRSEMGNRLDSLANEPQRIALNFLWDCAPFKTVSETGDHRRSEVEFRDRQFAIVYRLKFYNPDFEDTTTMTWSSEYTESEPEPLMWSSLEPVYEFLTAGTVVAWIAAVLLACIFWGRQRRIGEAMLAMALLCAVLSGLDQSPNGFLAADRGLLVYAGIMFVLSIVMMVFPHRSRALGNRCIKCGYDLTGNRSGICPECGRAIRGAWNDEFARKLGEVVR